MVSTLNPTDIINRNLDGDKGVVSDENASIRGRLDCRNPRPASALSTSQRKSKTVLERTSAEGDLE